MPFIFINCYKLSINNFDKWRLRIAKNLVVGIEIKKIFKETSTNINVFSRTLINEYLE
jgi:hypothetical protein